jgi:putative inorganic carbon (HCO3(-)) transporter
MAVASRSATRLALAERSLAARVAIGAMACLTALVIGIIAGRSPKDAIGLVAVIAFVPVVLTRFTIGVGIFIVSTFLGISGTAQKGIGLLVILVALGFLISDRQSQPNFFADHKRLTLLVLLYLAWSVLGLTWATSTGDVLYSLSRYIPNLLVFFVVYSAARDRVDMRILAWFFVLGSAVAAGDAVLNPPAASAYSNVSRVGGTFGDPNYLAAVLVTGFALGAALTRARSLTIFGQASAAAAAALCLVGILFSVSRGGLIALGVCLLAAIVLAGRWRARLGFATLVVVLAGVGYFMVLAPAATRDRLTSAGDGGSGRTTIWKVGWREVVNNPIKGVGAGNFSDAGAKYVIEPGQINHLAASYTAYFIDTPTVAHNTYLEVLAEEGIPGMVLFMAIVLGALECARRAAIKFRHAGDEEMELLSYGVLCGTIGFLAASFFLSEEYSKQLYLLLAMGPSLLRVAGTLPVRQAAAGGARSLVLRHGGFSRTPLPSG